jgi:hypothetical protein
MYGCGYLWRGGYDVCIWDWWLLQCVFSSVVFALIVMIYAIYGYSTLCGQVL